MERKSNIDVLRIISCLAVVMIHLVTAPIGTSKDTVNISLIKQLNLIHNLLMWAVPVFFMITGYCLMKKKECTYVYCFRHVLKYVAILFTVGISYALLEQIYQKGFFSLQIILNSIINVVNGNLWAHMWFIYSIIGIYLVMPVLHKFMQQSEKEIFIFNGLLFLFTILLPTCSKYFSVGIEFPFGGYLFYVCFGGCVAKCNFNKLTRSILYVLGIVAFVNIIITGEITVWDYKSINVSLVAIGIFLFVSKRKFNPNKYVITFAECTLGIYLLHPFFINIALKVIKIDLLGKSPYIKLFLFGVGVLSISFILTYTLKKIPIIKKLF